MYLSSADWMTRNLSYRVETAFPIYDEDIKVEIMESLQLQLSDNVKARILDESLSNTYYQSGSDLAIRSQVETYFSAKRQTEEEVKQK